MSDGVTGAVPNAVDSSTDKLKQLTQSLIAMATRPQAGVRQPQPRAGYGAEALSPDKPMLPSGNKYKDAGATVYNLGAFVSNMVKAHKQRQVSDAVSEWQGFDAALQRAQVMAGDPSAPDFQQKVQQKLKSDPWIQANLDPANPKSVKRIKNMYKALNVDLLADGEENVHREGLKRFFRSKEALDKAKANQQKMQQYKSDPQAKQRAMQQSLQKLMSMQTLQQPDPKAIESAARAAEAMAGVEERRALVEEQMTQRKQFHLDTLASQEASRAQRMQIAQMGSNDHNKSLAERSQYHQQEIELRREAIQIAADKASTTGDIGSLVDQVEQGFPIDKLDAKDRSAVVEEFNHRGVQAPKPFTNQEQTVLDDALNQESKIRMWESTVENTKDANGQLSNKPLGTFWQALKYKTGFDTPESAMISDFSRERWSAIGGLVRGVRRGDILRDMIQHTPDPWKDSMKLMDIKLKALEANYSLARATALKEHGYTRDYITGNNLDDDIKGYEDHLKAAKADIQRLQKTDKSDTAVHGKGDIPN